MKSSEVEVGGTYQTKVGVRAVDVRIVREHPKGGWDATSVASGKPIRVKDAARLRPVKAAKVEPEPVVAEQVDDVHEEPTTEPVAATATKAATKAAQRATRAPRAATATEAAPRRMSCLDAAVAVLRAEGQPMPCKAMVEAMAAKGLWSTTAPTPAATLYSAILRELNTKGDEARFKKTGRGHFALSE